MLNDDPRLDALGLFTPEGYLTPGYGDHYLFLVGRRTCPLRYTYHMNNGRPGLVRRGGALKCSICGGSMRSDASSGVCKRNPACKAIRRAELASAGRGGALTCSICGGPMRSDASSGVCTRNPACRAVEIGAGRGGGGALRCTVCNGPLRAGSLYGVCHRSPECKRIWYQLAKPASAIRVKYRDEVTFRTKEVLRSAKYRAGKNGQPFSLTLADLPPIPEYCPVLGIKIQSGGHGSERNNSPSLDRLIPALGYVAGNVMWISNRANVLRRDATAEELHRVADYAAAIERGVYNA
jgi:hypothetical protein